MTHSLITADRGTHLKIVCLSLVAAIVVVTVGITARVSDAGASGTQVVKAGKPSVYSARDLIVR